jgi:hypothetical protein
MRRNKGKTQKQTDKKSNNITHKTSSEAAKHHQCYKTLVGKKCHKSFMRLRELCIMETGESFMEIETSSSDSLLDLVFRAGLRFKDS